MAPTAMTHVAGVIGDPVRHSLSPTLHNAAFDALGLDWVYVAFFVPAGAAPAAIAAIRALSIRGLSVTMPHKAAVATALDRLSPTARRLGAVNTVSLINGELHGDSTDGAGLVDTLRADHGVDPAGKRAVVLGAGGAARAVVLALAERGATVTIVARSANSAQACAALAAPAARVGPIDSIGDADLVINATPVGMTDMGLPLGAKSEWFGPGQLVVDLIYAPETTALLDMARARGADVANGLGMLVRQAARQFTVWTGHDAPVTEMWEAARVALRVAADVVSDTSADASDLQQMGRFRKDASPD